MHRVLKYKDLFLLYERKLLNFVKIFISLIMVYIIIFFNMQILKLLYK